MSSNNNGRVTALIGNRAVFILPTEVKRRGVIFGRYTPNGRDQIIEVNVENLTFRSEEDRKIVGMGGGVDPKKIKGILSEVTSSSRY